MATCEIKKRRCNLFDSSSQIQLILVKIFWLFSFLSRSSIRCDCVLVCLFFPSRCHRVYTAVQMYCCFVLSLIHNVVTSQVYTRTYTGNGRAAHMIAARFTSTKKKNKINCVYTTDRTLQSRRICHNITIIWKPVIMCM